MPAAGEVIGGRFALEGLVGSGGMASVWRARDQQTGSVVALKMQHDAGGREGERLLREGQVLAQLDHAAIVRIVDCGQDAGGTPWLAMEWLPGEDLAGRLARGRLTVAEAVSLGRQTAGALAAAHAGGIVHRDIKPANLFLVDGRLDALKVLDFGIARWVVPRGEALTALHAVIGTPGYMAPEQARGRSQLDPRTDLFALGAVLWEALSGRPAFVADSLVAILAKILFDDPPALTVLRPDVPADLSALVGRMLAKSPDDRPADAAAVIEALDAIRPRADERDAPPPPARALGPAECRIVSVVLARRGPEKTISVERDTLPPSWADAGSASFVAGLATLADRVEELADGSLVLAVTSADAATDQVARAARAALAVLESTGRFRVALAMAEAVYAEGWQLEGAIDRAAALLGGSAVDELPLVRIDDATASLLDARFELRRDAFGLALAREGTGPQDSAPRRLLGRPTPFVGRERELRTLRAWIGDAMVTRRARSILVTGPPGIGKTRLRHELLRALPEPAREARVWTARGDPLSAGSPFAQLGALIHSASGQDAGRPAPLPPALAGLVERPRSLTVPSGRAPDPVLHGDQLLQSWLDLLADELSRAPLILVLDDQHWGDLPTVRFIDAALRCFADAPLVVLALARPGVHQSLRGLWASARLVELELGELPEAACEQLATWALDAGTPEATIRGLAARASGNALCLEEILRAQARGHGEALPPTVLAMMQGRLAALDAGARATLRAASVLGQTFWEGAAAALLPQDSTAHLRTILGDLVDQEIVEWRHRSSLDGEVEYAFCHALLREAAYASLTPDDRRIGHRLAAEWLERAGAPDAALLARHFELGESPWRAARHHGRAAQQALEGNELEAALTAVERAVACGAHGEELGRVRLLEATAHRWRGNRSEAWRAATEAAELLPAGSAAWFAATDERAGAALEAGRVDRLETLAALQLQVTAAPGAEEARVVAGCRTATCLVRTGREPLAAQLFGAVVEAQQDLLERAPLARGHAEVFRATCAVAWGDYGGYLELVERSIEAFREAGNLRDACLQAGHAAAAAVSLGRPDRAEEILRELLPQADRLGLANVSLHARLYLAYVLGQLGRFDEGIAVGRTALAAARQQGHRRFEVATLSNLAFVELLRGDPEAGHRWAAEAAALPEVPSSLQPLVLGTLADALHRLGRTAEAIEVGRRSLAVVTSTEVVEDGDVLTRLVLAEALATSGALDEARILIAQARDDVLARAALIRDPEWRRSYLQGVDDNARTLARARQWLPT